VFQTPDQLPLMRAGAVRAYAVTSNGRLAIASDIPTFEEIGLPAISYSGWYGLFARSGTPRDTVSRLNAAVLDALSDLLLRSRLTALGLEPFPRERQTPEALGALVKTEAEKWWPLIKEFGIKVQ
jgi:tripartite-type tricarboxylate transporter receptor subunit TctC